MVARAVKETALLASRVRPPTPGVVVLIYHRVGGRSGSEVDLEPAMFTEQMSLLAESGIATTFDHALRVASGQEGPPDHPLVAVTFDDGTADFGEQALPVLERYGIPALLYLATAFVEEGRSFPGDAAPISWGALRDSCSTGLVQVGSHTHSHALLDRIAPADVDEELDRSIGLIEARLGVPALDFAYPKALLGSAPAQRAVRSRFRSAAVAGTRPNPVGRTDPFRVARSPIQRSDGIRFFEHKLMGRMAAEDRLRTLVNRRRYRDATE